MKRFLSAVSLCVLLLIFGLSVLLPSAIAEKNLLRNLLDLPAPPPPNPLIVSRRANNSTGFFDRNKPPGDDVAIEDLLAYWQGMNQFNRKTSYAPKPSEKTFERLRGEIESNPELLPGLINTLPDTEEAADFVKNLYDRELSEKKYERDWRDTVRNWLTYHSGYFSDDLLRTAQQVADASGYVTNQEELLALARVDWEKARPILERLLNDGSQPVSQTLARWAFYNHAVKEKNSSDAEKYRRELQATVENVNAKPGNRDLAMDALIETGDFEGRDEWYFSLLEDETLHDLKVGGTTYTGLTTLLNHSPSDKYTAKMLELVKSNNAAVRSAAISNLSTLLDGKNPEVVRALLPWLENPDWAKQTINERHQLVAALRELTMPESVPGLIAMLNEKLNEKQNQQRMLMSANSMSNSMVSMNSAPMSANSSAAANSSMMTMTNSAMNVGPMSGSDYYPYRDQALTALAMQKDIRAVPALRTLLPQIERSQRGQVVGALLASGGFSISEQVEALEFAAKNRAQRSGSKMSNSMSADFDQPTESIANQMTDGMVSNGNYSSDERPLDSSEIKSLLATQFIWQSGGEELVTALIERIAVLDVSDAPTAAALRKIVVHWSGAAVNRLLLKDLKADKADGEAVVKLLSLRKSLRENQSDAVFDARGGTPTALGIAACLLENTAEYDAILAGENVEAKTALLACARLIRAVLPVRKVAENIKSANKTLALVAERYLVSEDSPEAGKIVLSLHPNEAVILGARTHFAADDNGFSYSYYNTYLPALFKSVNDSLPTDSRYVHNADTESLIDAEKKLRKEVIETRELVGIYAYGNNFVRIFQDKAVFSWHEDKARYRERVLEKEEFERLKSYLAAENVNELPPFLSECAGGCQTGELLMLGRQGGRRVFLTSDSQPKFFAELDAVFAAMREPPAKLHYWLEKNVAGLEILFEDENLQAETVWKNGEDFRVLLNNAARRKEIDQEIEQFEESDERVAEPDYEKIERARQKRREQREYENYSWNKIVGNKIGGGSEQPPAVEFLPKLDGALVRADQRQWKARATGFELRADAEGLYKISDGRAAKIRDGYFDRTLVTANGRWAATINYSEEGNQMLRINLATNKQFPVKLDPNLRVEPIVFVSSLNRFLLFAGNYGEHDEHETEANNLTEREGDFYLLDAETGALQKASGELRPLVQQTYRPLQPTGKPDEFWAAIPDAKTNDTQVGVYNQKTLVFKSLVKIPQITFDSMQMWIDANKVYFVYQGHLLALLMPK